MASIRQLFIFTIFISSFSFGQSSKKKELKTELIGTWEFVELRDLNGNKIDTIWHDVPELGLDKRGYEIPSGPLLTYNSDGTYSKQFTPQHTDNGTWYFDKRKKAIIQALIYPKPYSYAAQYLIDKGHAKQNKDGDYYEVITDKVVELTDDRLVILELGRRKRIFKKRK